jgi:hypothetical protein
MIKDPQHFVLWVLTYLLAAAHLSGLSASTGDSPVSRYLSLGFNLSSRACAKETVGRNNACGFADFCVA